MNMKKNFFFVLCALISLNAFCADIESTKSLTVDFAFYPESDFVAGDTHFAPLTGVYGGVEGRATGSLGYTIPTPLGEHWLLSDANIKVKINLELSPVSIAPETKISFTPLPFLVFETGAKLGTGWNIGGLQGMAVYNGVDGYDNLKPFQSWFTKYYVQGTFQFDTGALIEGDWSHVQVMYTYQAYYSAISGIKNGEIWEWQCSGNKANGWQNYQNIVLAYQMPLALSRVGVLTEIEGHYKDDDYNPALYKNYKGSFKTISISPLMQFTFGEDDNHSLAVLFGFSSRRSYKEEHTDSKFESHLTYAGREWFFNRIALSWTMTF
jgi:hypothetical protein